MPVETKILEEFVNTGFDAVKLELVIVLAVIAVMVGDALHAGAVVAPAETRTRPVATAVNFDKVVEAEPYKISPIAKLETPQMVGLPVIDGEVIVGDVNVLLVNVWVAANPTIVSATDRVGTDKR